MIKLNGSQSPRYGSLTFLGRFLCGGGGGGAKNVFDSFQPINIANAFVFPPRDRSLNVKLWRVLDSKSNKHPSFIKARPHYAQQSPCSAISTGSIVAFGSPWPADSLAEDCRLIIARRHWNLLKFLTNVHECKASCFLNNEWCETLI